MHDIANIRAKQPLIFNIMNEVATNLAANGLIAIGASPSMSHTPKEATELAQLADAVVLNLGTLTEERAEAMMLAGKAANEKGIPVILDPIAIGATSFRTDVIYDLLKTVNMAVIKGNAGEIAVLGDALDKMASPDSLLEENDPDIAAAVARKYNTVVIATGQTDVITDGLRTTLCHNGDSMLQHITASGCLLGSLVGAFVSVSQNVYHASIQATTALGIAAELAKTQTKGSGSFIPALLDQLFLLQPETLTDHKTLQTL